ncbi:Hint domain-containing protein, partial [Nioella sediminis]|uniref:Hint domain-containing protein n=1 Tax=Nioella sediminis TaxID=1912092 RepID=UPI001878187D
MPNYTTSEYVYFLSSSPVSANSFTYGSSVDQIGDIEFVDDDNSGTASAGDTWGDPSITYSGYTVTVGGEDFAVFQQDDGVGGYVYYIPHDGQISATDFTSPISLTPNANATVVNCFLEGTQVASDSGSVTVETLKIMDKVENEDGVPVPVKWIG